jgi:pyridoxal phosphate enzyme (YggS family)
LAFFIPMAFFIDSYNKLVRQLSGKDVTLVAVSKTKPVVDILDAYAAGQRVFGENYVQELVDKQPQLPADIEWHFIGHLQTNKVKYIAPFVDLIHGVDSERLLKEISKQALKSNRTIRCLLQVHIAKEETKFGLDESELIALVEKHLLQHSPEPLPGVEVVGLMGMASFSTNEAMVRTEFMELQTLFDQIKNNPALINPFHHLSMGMSGDYPLALTCGSNMIRVGSLIFGERNAR